MLLVEMASDEDRKSATDDREELIRRQESPSEAPRLAMPAITPLSPHDSEIVYVKFRVADSGCGIPASRHRQIFEPFMQVQ